MRMSSMSSMTTFQMMGVASAKFFHGVRVSPCSAGMKSKNRSRRMKGT